MALEEQVEIRVRVRQTMVMCSVYGVDFDVAFIESVNSFGSLDKIDKNHHFNKERSECQSVQP
jgi:hypothetical protein